MYELIKITDTLKIAPRDFKKPQNVAIVDEIDRKFANKIVHERGLAVATFDLLNVEDKFVHPSEGCVRVKATFRMIMFRPFVGEIILGRIRASDASGLDVTIGFFDDIRVPKNFLPQPIEFVDGLWMWLYEGQQLFFDLGEQILFRVVMEEFLEVQPSPMFARKNASIANSNATGGQDLEGPAPVANYKIIGDVQDMGLGVTRWWQ